MKIRSALTAASLSILTLTLAPALAQEEMLSAEAVLRDLNIARTALEDIHPGYTRFTERAALDAMWAELEAEAANGMSGREFYLGLAAILGAIRCDHTKAELPQAWIDRREEDPVYLPFRFDVFDGRMYVDNPGDTGLTRGDEILAIDGVAASERMTAILPLIAIDGFTDHTRWVTMVRSGEELGSGFDHYDPLLNPDDARVEIRSRNRQGEEETRLLDRLTYSDFRAITGVTEWRNLSDADAVEVTYPADGVATLAVNTFVNYRTPVDPDTVFGPVMDEIAARDTQTLIVDMRRNGGGSTDAQNSLIAHLSRGFVSPLADIRVKTLEFGSSRAFIDTWDPAALNPPQEDFVRREDGWWSYNREAYPLINGFDAAENAFDGQLILLIGPGNASGATQMIGALSVRGDTLLVGEPTGGTQEGPTAGVLYFLELPESGIRVRVPWQFWESSIPDPVIGYGFNPDVSAPLTLDAWLADRDPALEAALEIASAD